MKVWTGFLRRKTRSNGGFCEYGAKHSGSMNEEAFLEQVNNYELVKEDILPQIH
jgi:hypothetical protein